MAESAHGAGFTVRLMAAAIGVSTVTGIALPGCREAAAPIGQGASFEVEPRAGQYSVAEFDFRNACVEPLFGLNSRAATTRSATFDLHQDSDRLGRLALSGTPVEKIKQMIIRLFDIQNGKTIPTEHCYAISSLKAIMDNYPDTYMSVYQYLFYMTCPNPDMNPFFFTPEKDKERTEAHEALMELSKGEGFNFFVEAAGAPHLAVPEMVKGMAINAKIVQIGRAAQDVPLYLETFQVRRSQFFVAQGQSGDENFPNVIRMVASGRLDLSPMITARFPLKDAVKAIEQGTKRTDGKVMVFPNQ